MKDNKSINSFVSKNTFFSVFLVVVLPLLSSAQSFVECAQVLKKEYKSVENRLSDRKIQVTTADSLERINFANFDSCIVGKTLPDFLLTGKSGKIYTRDSLLNKVVMLNIWSVRCGPCIMEIPVLNKIANYYRGNDKFILLSIVAETQEEINRLFERFPTKRTIDFDLILNSKRVIKEQFQLVESYPTTFFLNQEGKIYKRMFGGITDPKDEVKLEMKYRAIIDCQLIDQ